MKTRKIAINNKHGGFNLSPTALSLFARRKGKDCYFFTSSFESGVSTYTPITLPGLEEYAAEKHGYYPFYVAFSVADMSVIMDQQDRLRQLPLEQRSNEESLWRKYQIHEDDINRDDSDLIAVIEELGVEKASGYCCELKVVEIPDDIEWTIQEYDGLEWVAEKHRTWQ